MRIIMLLGQTTLGQDARREKKINYSEDHSDIDHFRNTEPVFHYRMEPGARRSNEKK
jgi:hypothetical protein